MYFAVVVASVTNDSSNRGHVFGVATGTATLNACTGTVCGYTAITVGQSGTNAPPTILSASATGSLLTISGNGFGTSSAVGIVTINGAVVIPNSYSNTQIIVPMPPQATTLSILVTVAGVPSNLVFISVPSGSVGGSPTIVNLSPAFGAIGTPVTITGTSLGSAEGSSVMFNGAGAVPSSWSETKIVVTVPNAATTGNVVVTVAGIASPGVNFTVLQPTSMNITPANPTGNEGSSLQFHATAVYSSGSTRDVTSAVSWSSSQTGVAAIDGNGVASLLAVGQANIQAAFGNLSTSTNLTVNWSGSSSSPYQVFPSSLKMNVGDTRTLSVADSSGNPVTGLRWSSTNPDVVELSTANPPLIIGVAAGSATVYAGVVPVPVIVYPAGTVLPPGTPIWSLPITGDSSSGSMSLIPAIPYFPISNDSDSPSIRSISPGTDAKNSGVATQSLNPDIYALNGGVLTAISDDHSSQILMSGIPSGTIAVPGFQGDVYLLEPVAGTMNTDPPFPLYAQFSIFRVDNSGSQSQLYTTTHAQSASAVNISNNPFIGTPPGMFMVPHPSGKVFVIDGQSIVILDSATHQQVATITLPDVSTITSNGSSQTAAAEIVSNPIIAGNGKTYIAYTYFTQKSDGYHNGSFPGSCLDVFGIPFSWVPGDYSKTTITSHFIALEITPDGTYFRIPLKDYTFTQNVDYEQPPGTVYPTGDVPNGTPVGCGTETKTLGEWPRSAALITNADAGVTAYIPYETLTQVQTAHVYISSLVSDRFSSFFDIPYTGVTDAAVVADGGVSVTHILQDFMPILQRSDGSYLGVSLNTTNATGAVLDTKVISVQLVAVNVGGKATSDATNYPTFQTDFGKQQISLKPLYATAAPDCTGLSADACSALTKQSPDGGMIVTTSADNALYSLSPTYALDADGNLTLQNATTSASSGLSTLYTLDSGGNIVSQTPDTGAVMSWTGNFYATQTGNGRTIAANVKGGSASPKYTRASESQQQSGEPNAFTSVVQQQPLQLKLEPSHWPWLGGNGTNNATALITIRTEGKVAPGEAWNIWNLMGLGTAPLGMQAGWFGSINACIAGYELIGNVPKDIKRAYVRRVVDKIGCYYGDQPVPLGSQGLCSRVPGINDTGANFTSVPDATGNVYNLDAPGLMNGHVSANASGLLYRQRVNFTANVVGPAGGVISPPLKYYVRLSCRTFDSGDKLVTDGPDYVPGDNIIGMPAPGETPSTAWNLK